MIWDKIAYIILSFLSNIFWFVFAYYQYTNGHTYWCLATLIVFCISCLATTARLNRWYGKV